MPPTALSAALRTGSIAPASVASMPIAKITLPSLIRMSPTRPEAASDCPLAGSFTSSSARRMSFCERATIWAPVVARR
jgi:hypothetical protein